MARRNPYAAVLASVVKRLAKAKLAKAYALVYEAFVVVAATGDVEAGKTLVGWLGELPVPAMPPTAISASAIDGFRFAAGLGDRTLEPRVLAAERSMRHRLVASAHRPGPINPVIDRWRSIQELATAEATEGQALTELESYVAEWDPKDRGPGYGAELVLALELAFRLGRTALVPSWLERQGHRFASEPFLLQESLCLPAIASAIVGGALRAVVGLDRDAIAKALADLEAALATTRAAAKAPPARVPKIQKRRVSCAYSQFYVEPEVLDPADDRVYFHDPRESDQGMSIFPARVAVGTPSETSHVDVEVAVATKPPDLDGVVQAVVFPMQVNGPLCLRCVGGGDDDEPVIVPLGRHDVLARFYPKRATAANARAALRTYRVVLSFLPAGALDAPRCLRLDDGRTPPQETFVNPAR